jgi:hypothetical protein
MNQRSDEFISETDLDEMERRERAATGPPWQSFLEGRDHTSGSSFIRTENGSGPDIELLGATDADQDFIAHARQDVPRLLREIRRLRSFLNGSDQ